MSLRTAGRLTFKGVALLVGFVLVGNLVILGASWWAKKTTPPAAVAELPGVKNLEAVDAQLWRGAAPTPDGYRALAANGVKVVVDLRAEPSADDDETFVRSLGMRLVRLPVRDGQVPSAEQVQSFLRITQEAGGLTYVHCGAGVGRTGTMAGAYLVGKGELNSRGALRRNLAVGPPTLEQLSFVANLGDEVAPRPPAMVTAFSRLIDSPRRLYHNLGL